MTLRILLFLPLFFIAHLSIGQSTWQQVYELSQQHCATAGCHSNAAQAGALDLEGSGATLADRMSDVHSQLVWEDPSNSTAVANNNYLVYPGDPYRSFLYRKINAGLAPEVMLETGEGDDMPKNQLPMDDKEIELVRQWILYGAPETGIVADTALIRGYYDNGGINSLLQVPAPPPEGEGFQIHLGPFFIAPSEVGQPLREREFFSKYLTDFDSNTEVYKIETFMGNYSHHSILWKFFENESQFVPFGLREVLDFDHKEFVMANQFSEGLDLPNGAAFEWEAGTALDVNSHYVNYSTDHVTACEVYLNVWTQPSGTANEIMQSALIPNFNIWIPNDNQPYTFEHDFFDDTFPIPVTLWIWGVASHTHQYGTDFNIYRRNPDGTRGDQLYDAGCPGGTPGCSNEFYDYQHPPTLYTSPFFPIQLEDGAISEASYQNDGPNSVGWGFTSDDEMMVYAIFYVLDTTGVDMGGPPSSITPIANGAEALDVYPNPTDGSFTLPYALEDVNSVDVTITDITGRMMFRKTILQSQPRLDVDLPPGPYFISILDKGKQIAHSKFVIH